ncbi:MAG: 50S ribosomal protein L22 [Candidatus Nanopelagicaceae bacterium]|jgi:large subunit ribosomal protein L22
MGGRKLANTVATAKARSLRVTPQKARRVVNMIRGARLDEALNICKFSPQVAVSEDLYSLLNSAFANAKQKNPNIRDAKELWVAEALVDEGMTMKRYRPRAQGRGYQILKRSSQISVVVSDDKNYRSHGPLKGGKKRAKNEVAAVVEETAAPEAAKSGEEVTE